MFFLLFGSSCSGKTVALDALRGRVDRLAIHDFDEIGVPAGADLAWRHRASEEWVQRALECQADGTDLLLAGQAPLGELLAAPSASGLEAISACLLDCNDPTRMTRLLARGSEWLSRTGGTLTDYADWADWVRGHATDPKFEGGGDSERRGLAGDAVVALERLAQRRSALAGAAGRHFRIAGGGGGP